MQSSDYLNQYGRQLLALGYELVPIKPGFKYPKGLPDWESIPSTPENLERWKKNGFAGGGVGVRCKSAPAIDIDVLDGAVTDQVVKIVEEVLGREMPLARVGLPPKILLPCRTDEPFTKTASPVFKSPDGKKHKLEILGDGQQYVAYAIHPDTGLPYEWIGPEELVDRPLSDLPLLTHEQAKEIIRRFIELVKSLGWEPVAKGTWGGAVGENDPLANAVPPVDIDADKLREVVFAQDPDAGYDAWLRVGMALYHQFNGGQEGYDLWLEWSEDSKDFDPEECQDKWPSFDTQLKRRPVTVASLLKDFHEQVKEERAARGEPLDVDDFVARFIHVERGDLVCDTTKPPHLSCVKRKEFEARYANVRIEIEGETPTGRPSRRVVPVASLWLTNPQRRSAEGESYDPNHPAQFVDDHGLNWVNTFYLPGHPEVAEPERSARLQAFFDHVGYLVDDPADREWFLDWMAFNVQEPGRRSTITPLHISAAHGTGRGWIVRVMKALLGKWNCTKTKMSVLVGEGSAGAFQDFFYRSLFCAIEEVREGEKRFRIDDKIRDYLTEDSLEINVKFGGKQTMDVYTNFFFMSNHHDALVLTTDDRRIYVLGGPDEAKSAEYYEALYTWIKDRMNVAALFSWLKDRDLARFKANQNKAPLNEAKRRLIDNNQSGPETYFEEFITTCQAEAFTVRQVDAFIRKKLKADGVEDFEIDVNDKRLSKWLQRHAVKRNGQIETEDGRVRMWVRSSAKKIITKPALMVKEYQVTKEFVDKA